MHYNEGKNNNKFENKQKRIKERVRERSNLLFVVGRRKNGWKVIGNLQKRIWEEEVIK